MRIRFRPWTVAAALVAATFFVLALRPDVYEATSPHYLTWHVLLRKSYSIVAFTIVGFLFRRALGECGATHYTSRCIVATALYSAAIEAGQFANGSTEGLGWNLFDTLCGAAGGAFATADRWLTRPRIRAPRPR